MKAIVAFFILLAVCGSAAAQNKYDGLEPFSVWEQSRQVQRDYIEQLKKRLAADPNNFALRMNLGRAYHWLALEREEVALIEGEKLFAEIIERDPANAAALAYHGSLLGLKLGYGLIPKDQRAAVGFRSCEEIDRAVSLAPDSIEVRQVRGYASFHTPSSVGRNHLAVEDFTEVIRLLERLPDSEWRRGEVHLILGDAYRKAGDVANARANWERASRLLAGSSLALAAETRLRNDETQNETAALNVKKLTALFGFLIGAIIFAILSILVLRDLIRMRRRRSGIAASLIVSLAALLWNGLNLTAAAFAVVGAETSVGFQRLADLHQRDLYLIFALSPIPFGLMMAYRFYKATFMDIVLKRGAALLAIFILSIIYARLVDSPARAAILQVSNGTLRAILFAGVWLWIYALYPPARDRIYRLVDRHVFKRRDYSRLLDWFHDRLREVTDEASLISAICESLKEAFAADRVRFHPASEELAARISKSLADQKADVLLRRRIIDDELEAELEREGIELALAVRSSKESLGIILIGARAYDQGYLSEELSVLRAVAAQIGRTIENLRLHEARRRQAMLEEELRKLAAQAELKALRAQIDPHFFFNALNSVASLISDDPKAAEELIEDISDLFRHSFRTSREFTTMGEEIELVETYLRVERIRLGDRLRFEKMISPDALAVKIPALTIQPLIENSVNHGIGRSNGGGSVTLSATIRDGSLNVSVADTGSGIAQSEMAEIFSLGVGLANVNGRLTGLYGERAALRIDSRSGEGTTVSFAVPLAAAGRSMEPA